MPPFGRHYRLPINPLARERPGSLVQREALVQCNSVNDYVENYFFYTKNTGPRAGIFNAVGNYTIAAVMIAIL